MPSISTSRPMVRTIWPAIEFIGGVTVELRMVRGWRSSSASREKGKGKRQKAKVRLRGTFAGGEGGRNGRMRGNRPVRAPHPHPPLRGTFSRGRRQIVARSGAQIVGSSKPLRGSRESRALASGSFLKVSVSTSQASLRPTLKAMLPRWQVLVERWRWRYRWWAGRAT